MQRRRVFYARVCCWLDGAELSLLEPPTFFLSCTLPSSAFFSLHLLLDGPFFLGSSSHTRSSALTPPVRRTAAPRADGPLNSVEKKTREKLYGRIQSDVSSQMRINLYGDVSGFFTGSPFDFV